MKKTILVTGGTGYIGSQLVCDLATDERFHGCAVRIYDNLQRGNYHVLMDLPSRGHYEFIEGDVLDRVTLGDAMRDVWAVVHLAAVVSTPISFDHPDWTKQVNHWGTATVVDEAVNAGVERVVYACSASVYGPGGPFDEEDGCHPVGPYSTSKLQGEEAVMSATHRSKLKVTSLRLGTAYGDAPGVRFEAVANRFAYLAGVGKAVIVHGDGEQRRPFIHVRDASMALRFALANRSTEGKILNAVTQNATVKDLVNAVRQILPDVSITYTDQDVLNSLSFQVSGHRLESLGWRSAYTLDSGMHEIIERLAPLRGVYFPHGEYTDG